MNKLLVIIANDDSNDDNNIIFIKFKVMILMVNFISGQSDTPLVCLCVHLLNLEGLDFNKLRKNFNKFKFKFFPPAIAISALELSGCETLLQLFYFKRKQIFIIFMINICDSNDNTNFMNSLIYNFMDISVPNDWQRGV